MTGRTGEAYADPDGSEWWCVALWDEHGTLVRRDAFPTRLGAIRVLYRWMDHGITKGWDVRLGWLQKRRKS